MQLDQFYCASLCFNGIMRTWDTDPLKLKLKEGENQCGYSCRKMATKFVPILASNKLVKIENLAKSFYRHVEYVIMHLTINFYCLKLSYF